MDILQLDIKGMPQAWIKPEDAACYYATDSIAWTVGETCATLRGGYNAILGRDSRIDVHPIIAVNGASRVNLFDAVPVLTNQKLFRRDRCTCAYCGEIFHEDVLTREHIVPQCQNGHDVWANVVAACKSCNSRKAGRTPEQADMPLLFSPYVPSVFEGFLLARRNIRGDVHEWLASRVGKGSRWSVSQ